ncbi:MAG TPA: hypothetical protein VFN65_10105 [Solirubrobacteraceae bacterium]|nr:hypothetical protein [Solirubrobacteraceae bacterium]
MLRPRLRAPRALLAALALCAIVGLAAGAERARAGQWTLVSCSQPDGQPAPTDGWAPGYWAGGATPGSGDTDTCPQAGGALTAESGAAGPAASATGPEWIFTAPAGATIAGGSVTASLTAPHGEAWIGTPGPALDGADVIVGCQQAAACGASGTLSGTFPIDHPGGTAIYAPALCVDSSLTCPQTAATPNAAVSITRAEIELSDAAVPWAQGFSGPLLSGRARGTAVLRFHGGDQAAAGGFGPGIYAITVQIDGRTAYHGVPDSDAGTCVPLGTDPATGGLMFDHAQPCAPQAILTIPVPTAGLSDGRHRLTVALSDAAQNTATVLRRSIITSNPVISPRPRRPFEVATRLALGWVFAAGRTRVDSARALGLPARGTVAVSCRGRRCPRLALGEAPVARIGRLWAELEHVTLHPGDRLDLTLSAPQRRPEPIQFRIRAGRTPTVHLLRSR